MKTLTDRKKTAVNTLLAALLAAAAFIILCALNNISPFGTNTVLRNDGLHQYAPFLLNYCERIKDGASVLFSWQSGGGTNMFTLICYYLLSPFNFIGLFFNSSDIDIAMWFIILAKTVCMAASSCYYFQKKTSDYDFIAIAFSLVYTFGGFYIAYYYNTMWLDALIMLPLIALGIENIVNGKKATLYFISLAYAIFVNFYLGYMICIFAVLYFFYLIFSKDISRNASEKAEDEAPIMKVMLKFGVSSLFAGLICFVVILPVIFAIGNTLGKTPNFGDGSFFNFLDFLSAHLTGVVPPILAITEETLPYAMGSMLTLLTVPAFFFLKNVKPNKKVATAAVLAIFYFSFCIPKMNAFWHGFAEPSGLPYRFVFLYLFFIITLAYEVVRNLKSLPVWSFGVSAALVAAALVYTRFSSFKDHFTKNTVIISAVAVVVYFVILLLLKYEKLNKRFLQTALCVLIAVEIVSGNRLSLISDNSFDNYFKNASEKEEAAEYVEEQDKNARLEVLEGNSFSFYNNPAMYGYNGLSSFSSLADSLYSFTQNMMGNVGNNFNQFTYSPQTPVYNSVFSLDYVLDLNKFVNAENPFYEKVKDIGEGTLYKVKYTLPMGYCVSKNIENWDPADYRTLAVHSQLWKSITGQDDLIVPLKEENIEYKNCTAADKNAINQYIQDHVTENAVDEHEHEHDENIAAAGDSAGGENNDSYDFTKNNLAEILSQIGGLYAFKATADNFSVSFDYKAQEDGEVYALASSGSMQTLTVIRQNGEKYAFDVSKKHLNDIGYFTKGETYTLVVSNPDRDFEEYDNSLTLTDSIQMSVGSVNEAKFSEAYNKILDNGALQIKEFEDSHIYGTVNAKSDCVMMLPMPYDEGWTVFVDGEAVELTEHTSHIMMFELSAGEHEIELSYFPLGLKEGIFVSAAAALGLVMVLLLGKVHKMKMELAQEEQTKDSDEKGKE